MKVSLLITFCFVLLFGCVTDPSTGKQTFDSAKALTTLKNTLALAQVGYQDYALLSGKSSDPKVNLAMQTVDNQLAILGALAYNVVNPSPEDIAKAQAALKSVNDAKASMTNPTPAAL